jgi:hypothetical protein
MRSSVGLGCWPGRDFKAATDSKAAPEGGLAAAHRELMKAIHANVVYAE